MNKEDIKKGKIVFYVRDLLTETIICELNVRTVKDTWFTGVEKKDKQAFLIGYNMLDKRVFSDRKAALKIAKEIDKTRKKKYKNEDELENLIN